MVLLKSEFKIISKLFDFGGTIYPVPMLILPLPWGKLCHNAGDRRSENRNRKQAF